MTEAVAINNEELAILCDVVSGWGVKKWAENPGLAKKQALNRLIAHLYRRSRRQLFGCGRSCGMRDPMIWIKCGRAASNCFSQFHRLWVSIRPITVKISSASTARCTSVNPSRVPLELGTGSLDLSTIPLTRAVGLASVGIGF